MKRGISFYFGYKISPKKRVEMIKNAKFDCVIANADPRFILQNGSFRRQISLFKKYGIEHSSLHMRYKDCELSNFWKDCKIGKRMERDLKKDIRLAKKYNFTCVVVHLLGEPNEFGLNRFKRILAECDKYDVDVAVENIQENSCFKYVFEKINNPHLKFCFDCGHNNVWDKDIDFLSKYGDKLATLHLHDNMGEKDEHTINKYGNIDWRNLAKKIAKINPNINLDYEIMMYRRENETAEEVLNIVYKQACELEQMVQEETLILQKQK